MRAEQLPTHLYKYVSRHRLSILNDGLIRFTQPHALNDPFEIRPVIAGLISDRDRAVRLEAAVRTELAPFVVGLDKNRVDTIVERAVREIGANIGPFLDRAIDGALVVADAKMSEGANRAFGVLSLSENPKSSLMWAHYAENYEGMVLQFDTGSEFFQLPVGIHEDFGGIRKVVYAEGRPVFDFGTDGIPSIEFLYTKPREWSYEAEWRMLRPLSYASKSDERRGIYLYTIPPNALTAVILGFRATRDTFDLASRAIAESPIMKGSTLKAVRPSRNTFDLEIVPVSSWEDLDANRSRVALAKHDVFAALEQSNALADLIGPSLAKKVFRP